MFNRLLAVILIMASSISLAQDVRLSANPLEEFEHPRARVSTDLVVGVMIGSDTRLQGIPNIRAKLPTVWPVGAYGSSQVCLRMTSKSGHYEAFANYLVDEARKSGQFILDYPTTMPDLLQQNLIAARVTLGGCDEPSEVFTPVMLQDFDESHVEYVSIFLNTGGARTGVRYGKKGRSLCDDITEGSGLKYTTRCNVPLDQLEPGSVTPLRFIVSRNEMIERFEIKVVRAGELASQ